MTHSKSLLQQADFTYHISICEHVGTQSPQYILMLLRYALDACGIIWPLNSLPPHTNLKMSHIYDKGMVLETVKHERPVMRSAQHCKLAIYDSQTPETPA